MKDSSWVKGTKNRGFNAFDGPGGPKLEFFTNTQELLVDISQLQWTGRLFTVMGETNLVV